MSEINKSKTVMVNPKLDNNEQELLIKTKYISKENIEKEKSYYLYEKLKHNLKKRLREKIIDEYASNMLENESKKNIYTFASMNFKSDSKGLYHRLKKINQNKNIPFKLRACFMNWFYKTPNAVMKHRINIKSKNDRNRTIKIKYYRYENIRYFNVAKKITDMTTKNKKEKIIIQTPRNKISDQKPKYKYNYSCNNSNVSYSKSDFGKSDKNKGNIYIGKRNGNYYYTGKKYNNFGSLTIIQHNVENSKKNRYKNLKAESCDFGNNLGLAKKTRNKNVISTMCDSKSGSSKYSWTIFCNSFNKKKDKEETENKENLN